MIAIPWYFSDIIKMPSVLGWSYVMITFVTIFWSLYSGTLIDKYSRKRVFLMANLCGGILLGIVSLTGFLTGSVPIPLILIVFASTFFIFNIHYPNLYAFVQEITDKKDYGKLNSYIEIQGQTTTAAAGAAAAVLLSGVSEGVFNFGNFSFNMPFAFEAVELHTIFLLNMITYFLAFSFILAIKYQPVLIRSVSNGKVIQRIIDGYMFLKNRPNLFLFGILSHNIFVIVLVKLFFLFAVYVSTHLQMPASTYATADMLFALGALFAGLFTRIIFKRVNIVAAILFNLILVTIIMFVFSISTTVIPVFIISFLLGLSNSSTRIMRVTYLFNHISNDVIGRANSVFTVVNTFCRMLFLGLFALPFFTSNGNVIYAYMIFGVFTLISAILLGYLYPRLPKH